MKRALRDIDAAVSTLGDAFHRWTRARNAYVKSTHRRGDANDSNSGADLSIVGQLSDSRFCAALANRLAGAGLRRLVSNPTVARSAKDARNRGTGFLPTWPARVDRLR
jgi:hypothetical protein